MFSGGDSSGEGFNSLNFTHFRPSNASGFVDWGSLAQQWIQMRDNNISSNVVIPEPPPPPNISGNHNVGTAAAVKKTVLEEKGEADMEMADDDEDLTGNHAAVDSSPPPPAPSMQLDETAVIAQQPHWFMQTPQTTMPIMDGSTTGKMRGSVDAQPAQTDWQQWPARVNLPPPTLHIPNMNPTAHIPSLMKINVPNPNTIKAMPDSADESSTSNTATVTMDAAKRKILPAWIREGLEKMEREKLRQIEKEQQTKSGSEGDAKYDLQNDLVVKNKSEKSLASDSSGNEDDNYKVHNSNDGKVVAIANATASALTSAAINDDSDVNEDAADSDDELRQSIGKSYEQKLADLMIAVRRSLTELLLEVTNEEISNVANEAIKLRKTKASSAQVIHKSALSSITNKLGLAAYDDSSSESSSDTENESNDNETHQDSEEEIKTSLRVKRRAFAKISEEIEERIAENAAQEEQKLKYYRQLEEQEKNAEEIQQQQQQRDRDQHEGRPYTFSEREREESTRNRYHGASTSIASLTSGKSYEREFGETTDSKLQQSSGKRQKERTTRFSDNKDSKSASIAAAASYISQMQSKINNANVQPIVPPGGSLFPMTSASAVNTSLDPNNLYTAAGQVAYCGTGINNVLNAADAALEKASKSKSKSSSSSTTERSRHHSSKHSRRHSSDDDSSDSDTSSSSSRGSKYSRHSSSRHKNRSSSDHHKRSSRSSSSRKSQRDYSSHKSSRHSSRRHSRSRSRSRSQSRSSYSSSRRRH